MAIGVGWPQIWASQVALVVKSLPASEGNLRDMGSALGSGRSPGGAHGNPLWYSCLENPMDKGAWWATVCGVAKSQTQLKQLSMHTQPQIETGTLEEEGGTDVKHPNTHEYPPLVPPDWLSHLTFHIKQPVLTVFFIWHATFRLLWSCSTCSAWKPFSPFPPATSYSLWRCV